ncbi:phosphoglycerate mutase-like protein [Punctularia strigosozonata HHB-11173 SS5]|uniref:phosphoglycerate mutase-like protein n=1 Tax=Punctularia strigosozonata (strain HHB-11173) TaxID=741275 RepID=UPI0004417007|nr:phosphoglycerate mutase-like protein [Punctularia strigosozonata HHB-11173 SS5]EIN08823.1 phosphoglycerate mutase-like protein [Punctularia strigosozonata HHB-11173 SS5]
MAPKFPKVYLVRHGETEWTINGRHTGTTDIPLTARGEATMLHLGEKVAGPGKLIDPSLLASIHVSPRIRAQKTFTLLFSRLPEESRPALSIDERVREWTYGDYEGGLVNEIAARQKEKGLKSGERGWDIWVDGCEGGESAEEMCARVDEVVKEVKRIHREWYEDPARKDGERGGDVLIVSHGHFSRCFLARWLELPLPDGKKFVLDPGGVCVGQYYHSLDHSAVGAINLGVL